MIDSDLGSAREWSDGVATSVGVFQDCVFFA